MSNNATKSCRRCGKCCLANLFFYISDEDFERWRQEGRKDILCILENIGVVWSGDHFVSSKDGRYMHGCPFIMWQGNQYACSIYGSRPRACREFKPGSSEICSQFRKVPERRK